MVTDQELANGVAYVLRQSDPTGVASVNGVVKELEANLGLDLSHKTAFIRDQIEFILHRISHHQIPPPKDHFSLQQGPQFQNTHPPPIPSFFRPPFHHHELQFRSPPIPPPPPQQRPPPPLQQQRLPLQSHSPSPSSPNVVPVAPETPKESTQTKVKRRGGPGGLTKVCGVSPALQTIVGEPCMPRTEIVKQLWAYIRKNNLQDPSNKRKIICNDALRLVFETDCTDMFKMNKLLSKHIISLEPTKDSVPDAKRLKAAVDSVTECTESSLSPVIISDKLANFFGTGEREMLQSEAVRRVWEYVKVNQLEDPLNSMVILCDSKLLQLFGCESVSALGISMMLMSHFYKRS